VTNGEQLVAQFQIAEKRLATHHCRNRAGCVKRLLINPQFLEAFGPHILRGARRKPRLSTPN
jgi:hypothetical protein